MSMYCGGHGFSLPCPECARNLRNRKDAEQAYTISAFDYVRDPVGSHNWELFFEGWQAALGCLPCRVHAKPGDSPTPDEESSDSSERAATATSSAVRIRGGA